MRTIERQKERKISYMYKLYIHIYNVYIREKEEKKAMVIEIKKPEIRRLEGAHCICTQFQEYPGAPSRYPSASVRIRRYGPDRYRGRSRCGLCTAR